MSPPARRDAQLTTEEKILVATEKAFALSELDTPSATDIARLAGQANSAVVNYYFKTRDNAVQEARNFRNIAINQFRGRLIARYERIRGLEEAGLFDLLFLLLAPTVAVVKLSLPESYHARFVQRLNSYNLTGYEKAVSEEWAAPAQRVMETLVKALSNELGVDGAMTSMLIAQPAIAPGLAGIEEQAMKVCDYEGHAKALANVDELLVKFVSFVTSGILKKPCLSAIGEAEMLEIMNDELGTAPPDFRFHIKESSGVNLGEFI
ncbi:AcrR family transcriptional regulator [Litorivivens lipolytica]|uniref:AcrR family transcriptional regulator n=1 Tax=Litorivivens lipolytica TaxID=1524264 RepID=A0A7W4Z738_9GAMM|nr:hypothetical protein [Litorivivens lipolytica]MBB3048873.1 AcrR family transcriptional regulator [Litorivivens lipolytica]